MRGFKPWTQLPLLKKGERVRLEGKTYTVIRVTEGAAYLASGDWLDADGQVLVREWSRVLAIAPRASIERVVD